MESRNSLSIISAHFNESREATGRKYIWSEEFTFEDKKYSNHVDCPNSTGCIFGCNSKSKHCLSGESSPEYSRSASINCPELETIQL